MVKNAAADAQNNDATRAEQPIILIRGFGGLGVEDEKRIAYQGFNDGTVYPQKCGENYIYEGLILRFMKSRWTYHDATNIVGYYNSPIVRDSTSIPAELAKFDLDLFSGHKVVIDPGTALNLVRSTTNVYKTLWVFRYYDLDDREDFKRYGCALVRLITFIQKLAEEKHQTVPKVNIIAHSMGGLIVREAVQRSYEKGVAAKHINKIVTLGTPHQGISFQLLQDWIGIGAASELEQFNPDRQKDSKNPVGFKKLAKHFPPERMLTVVGTNYRTYGPTVASWLNRAFSVSGEFGPNYNRSDGLVKQAFAQLPGAPRTFVHKCHGGPDSLVTSREAFEIATRFFFGNIKVRLNLVKAKVKRGQDLFGKSEFFFGVSIKPRGVDFELFHQSAEAENCYGPFSSGDLTDTSQAGVAFNWADGDNGERLIWEGWLDTGAATSATEKPLDGDANGQDPTQPNDIVMRLDFFLGERDLFGIGFSDNVVFRKQYYVRAVFDDVRDLTTLRELVLHTGEDFTDPAQAKTMHRTSAATWEFDITGTGFDATLSLGFDVA
ncbi:lipase/acyltransferase domain-containing protein [Ensifer aridi]|uniref:PGAP1-like alpha/beta domain-containing protein n=1 Tax=Ensifer aridi TaxID=1708715 RepID=UPI000A11731B|nr:alpha/beta hydrolase [Ensifer aridi]